MNVATLALAVAEGFCPNGHGRLATWRHNERDYGACVTCGVSWRAEPGATFAVACVPGDHTCRERWAS